MLDGLHVPCRQLETLDQNQSNRKNVKLVSSWFNSHDSVLGRPLSTVQHNHLGMSRRNRTEQTQAVTQHYFGVDFSNVRSSYAKFILGYTHKQLVVISTMTLEKSFIFLATQILVCCTISCSLLVGMLFEPYNIPSLANNNYSGSTRTPTITYIDPIGLLLGGMVGALMAIPFILFCKRWLYPQ